MDDTFYGRTTPETLWFYNHTLSTQNCQDWCHKVDLVSWSSHHWTLRGVFLSLVLQFCSASSLWSVVRLYPGNMPSWDNEAFLKLYEIPKGHKGSYIYWTRSNYDWIESQGCVMWYEWTIPVSVLNLWSYLNWTTGPWIWHRVSCCSSLTAFHC